MDKKNNIRPAISKLEISINFKLAMESQRKRHHKIIHEKGAEFNEVYNFMLKDTYMQPHLHPGKNKIEKIYVLQGKLALIFFNNLGEIDRVKKIFSGKNNYVKIPAFTWHTYVMLTERVLTFETMMGKFDPKDWKTLAEWAPKENSQESKSYIKHLKKICRSPDKYL